MNKIAFHNLGCKVNAYETEAMIRQLKEAGYEIVDFSEKADVYVVNTCTVTGVADKKSRQMLHRAKKNNPKALVVAVGCYVQADPARALADEAVDLVVGNHEKNRLAELIENKLSEVADINSIKEYEPLFVDRFDSHTRAFVKIQDGCNQFCSYCLIPYVRGRVRSREPEDVVKEIESIAAAGCKEVVLTGIHLSSYGNDGRPEHMGPALLDLISRLSGIEGLERIRLGSLEPRIITEEFAGTLAKEPKFCPHFHLSLQSGCDATLKRMNRHYTAAEFKEKCELLRRHFKLPAITTDVIVGFPGETEEEFACTAAYLRDLHLSKLHVFPYSLRKGTAAERLPGRVPDAVKAERVKALMAISEADEAAFKKAWSLLPREVL
ncbi:MAG: tRNA (N(6)-L-threonylcarbamoyladenosine(37)-C(2))-methylthiotransferase MtaB, partial [Lachnospiraceae bacterium]|nr:tRNA (N(6)-L-threonylcarbamoyladenosine(37)-C(2))-methylthiotransferase MtaB [Lachnospiraceae bacterium]